MAVEHTGEKKQNYALHLLCGIIVIILTAVKFDMRADIFDNLLAFGRFAIPLFFIISGYFLFSEDGHTRASLPRKMKHILLMTIAVKVLFLVIDLVYYAFGYLDMQYVLTAFFLAEETTMHVWFVYALLIMYFFTHMVFHYGWNMERIAAIGSVIVLTLILIFGVILRVLGINYIGDVYVRDISDIIYPFTAFPFFYAGYYLHMYRSWFDSKFSTASLVILTLIGFATPAIAAFWIPGSPLYFGSIVSAVTLFMLTFRVPDTMLRCRLLEFIGWKLKMFMYMFFPAVIFFLKNVAMASVDPDSSWYTAVGATTAVILNLFFSYLAYLILKKVTSPKKKDVSAESF